MKKLIMLMLGASLLMACKKDNNEPEETKTTTAARGKIAYKIDGKEVSYDGTGYILANDHSFMKWENSKEQLSIDFYGMDAGDYTVVNATKLKGNAKVYYYPDNANSNIVWIAKTGSFKVTAYDKTSGFKVSGSFSATLEKFNNNVLTGEKMEITVGSFKDIVLRDLR